MKDKGLSTCDGRSDGMESMDPEEMSFAQMRENGAYYVDKTLLIKDILDHGDSNIYAMTRPHGFGKTVNLTMLDAFFNEKYKGNTWFDGLEISRHPRYERYKNAFPVIYLDLRASNSDTYEGFIRGMISAMAAAFEPHRYLLEWESLRKPVRNLFSMLDDRDMPESSLWESVYLLSEALKVYSGKRVVVLIDGYDCVASDALGAESRLPMMRLIGHIMSIALKGNESLQMACLTGTISIDLTGCYGPNNVSYYSIYNERFDERFGFTENEVEKVLDDFGCTDALDAAKEWYGGYRFGRQTMFDPYCIMRFVSERGALRSYWSEKNSGVLMRQMLGSIGPGKPEKYTDIMKIVTGGTLLYNIWHQFRCDPTEGLERQMYKVLSMGGWLAAVPVDEKDVFGDEQFELSIPNRNVGTLTAELVREMYPLDPDDILSFDEAVLNGDADGIGDALGKMMERPAFSDLGDDAYRSVMLAVACELSCRYKARIETPWEDRTAYLVFRSEDKDAPHIIFAIKIPEKDDDIDSAASEALKNICDHEYCNGMEGRVILVGMSFKDGIPRVKVSSVMNGDGFALCDKKAGRA